MYSHFSVENLSLLYIHCLGNLLSVQMLTQPMMKLKHVISNTFSLNAGREIFFSDSHLAPKFFKVVANSKKVGHHFQRQTKSFFTLSAF